MQNNTNWSINYHPLMPDPYLCEHCGKTFTYKQALQTHSLSHGTHELICPDCNNQTLRKDNLHRHLLRVYHESKVGEKLLNVQKVLINKSTKKDAKVAPAKPRKTLKFTPKPVQTPDPDPVQYID